MSLSVGCLLLLLPSFSCSFFIPSSCYSILFFIFYFSVFLFSSFHIFTLLILPILLPFSLPYYLFPFLLIYTPLTTFLLLVSFLLLLLVVHIFLPPSSSNFLLLTFLFPLLLLFIPYFILKTRMCKLVNIPKQVFSLLHVWIVILLRLEVGGHDMAIIHLSYCHRTVIVFSGTLLMNLLGSLLLKLSDLHGSSFFERSLVWCDVNNQQVGAVILSFQRSVKEKKWQKQHIYRCIAPH
jgi:hypothetical protein